MKRRVAALALLLGEPVIDDELVDRVGIEPPRPRPVGCDVAGGCQFLTRRRRVIGEPRPDLGATRIVDGGKEEVHGAPL